MPNNTVCEWMVIFSLREQIVIVLSMERRLLYRKKQSATVVSREEYPQILRNVIVGQDGLSYRCGSYANGVMGKLGSSSERRDTAGPASWAEGPRLEREISGL